MTRRLLGRLIAARHAVARRLAASGRDAGMSTAEYAVGTIAACAFAVALYRVVTSDAVFSALADIVHRALALAF